MSYQDAISQAHRLRCWMALSRLLTPIHRWRLVWLSARSRAVPALIGYLPVGFPTLDESIDAAIALAITARTLLSWACLILIRSWMVR